MWTMDKIEMATSAVSSAYGRPHSSQEAAAQEDGRLIVVLRDSAGNRLAAYSVTLDGSVEEVLS